MSAFYYGKGGSGSPVVVNFASVKAALAAANSAVGFNGQALTSVSLINSIDITTLTPTETFTAGEAIAAGAIVTINDIAGIAKAFLADADGVPLLQEAIGYATNAAVLNASVAVQVVKKINVPDSLWDVLPLAADVGKRVWLSAMPGNSTLTAPGTGSMNLSVGVLVAGGSGNCKVLIRVGEGLLL